MSSTSTLKPLALPRLTRTGIIFHWQKENLATMAIAVVLGVGSLQIGGMTAFAVSAIVWAPLFVVGMLYIRDMPAPLVLLRDISFAARRASGRTQYRHRPDAESVVELKHEGHLVLPGRDRNVKLVTATSGGDGVHAPGEGAALLHDKARHTITVIAEVGAPAFLTTSANAQAKAINDYAGLHRGWTLRDGICRFTEIERTRVGSTKAVREYADKEWKAPADSPLTKSYYQALEQVETHVREHVTQMAWTFDLSKLRGQIKAAGGGEQGLAQVMLTEMETLRAGAVGAGFRQFDWLTPGQVRAMVRMQIDPLAVPGLQARAAAGTGEVQPGGEAVMSFDEARDYIHADSGFHRTWWIAQWPQTEVYPGVLQDVILGSMPDGSTIRHTIALCKAPVPIGRAMKRIQDRKKAWTASERMRQKNGQITMESDRHEWELLLEQERALVAGMGEYEVSAYVCISATSKDELDHASSAMHTHMSNAGLETHILYGQQAEALMMCAVPTGKGLA